CLTRCVWRGGDPAASSQVGGLAEVGWLNVLRTDAAGRIARMEQFGVDRLSEAVARLVELHADDELPGADTDVRYSLAAAFRSTSTLWRDDAVLVDHRPTSIGTRRGREAMATTA